MTAPTEQELRAALEARWNHPTDGYARNQEWIDYLSDALRGDGIWPAPRDARGDLVERDDDLAHHLDEAEGRIAERCRQIAIDEFVIAGMRYAGEHPDAPRARVTA